MSKHAMPATKAEQFDDIAMSLAEEAQRVTPGEYVARVIACRRQWRFGRELLVFQFRLVSPGPVCGAVLQGFCNLSSAGDRTRAIPARAKLRRWLGRLHEFDLSTQTARVPLKVFSQYEFLVQVVRPQSDYKRRPVAPLDQTPTVQEILRVVGKSQNAKI